MSTLCPLPWNHLFIDNVGKFYPCCISPGTASASKRNGADITVHQDNAIQSHWHSQEMTELRKAMLDNKRPSSCKNCWQVEDLNLDSYRTGMLHEFSKTDFSSVTPAEKYQFIDIRLGNHCNLMCRMCFPYASKKMIPEYAMIESSNPNNHPLANIDWFEKPEFWSNLLLKCDALERLNIAGGEPLLINQHFSFLEMLIDRGIAKNVELTYNTNTTVLPEKAKAIWKEFKDVKLLLSIDAFGDLNEYIRHPTRWKTVEGILNRIENEHTDWNITHAEVRTTVMAYNALHLCELLDFLDQYKFISNVPEFGFVTSPEAISAHALPLEIRKKAAKKLIDHADVTAKKSYNTHHRASLETRLYGVANFLDDGQDHPSLWREFIRYNQVFDNYRKQNVLKFIPEIEDFLP